MDFVSRQDADILLNIFRKMCSVADHSHSNDIILSSESPFNSLLPTIYTSLEIHFRHGHWEESNLLIFMPDENVCATIWDMLPELETYFTTFGKNIQSIKIYLCDYLDHAAIQSLGRLYELIGENCSANLNTLEVVLLPCMEEAFFARLKNVLVIFRSSLKNISVQGYIDPSSAHIQELQSAIKGLTSLTTIEFTKDSCSLGLGLWDGIGGSIRKITLDFSKRLDDETWSNTLSQIREHCPILTQVHFGKYWPRRGDDQNYMKFLESYGDSLISASVQALSVCSLRKLVSICPNLRICSPFSFDFRRMDVFSPRIAHLTTFLNKLFLSDADNIFIPEIIRNCENLVILRLIGGSQLRFRDSLSLYKGSQLTDLKELTLVNCITVEHMIDFVCTYTPNLRMIKCETSNTWTGNCKFDRIPRSLTELEEVYLEEYNGLLSVEHENRLRKGDTHLVRYHTILERAVYSFNSHHPLKVLSLGIRTKHRDYNSFYKICSKLIIRGVSCILLTENRCLSPLFASKNYTGFDSITSLILFELKSTCSL